MKLPIWQTIPRLLASRCLDLYPTRIPYRNARLNDSTRMFGAKMGFGNPEGFIHIENHQTALKPIDLNRLRSTMSQIRREIGYDTYDVTLILIEDDDMQEANRESRGKNQPTDILSFPFHSAVAPGEIELPRFDVPDYYNLGDMLIDVPYVIRCCQVDQEDSNLYQPDDNGDRGVSFAMSTTYDPEQRLHQLLVHGMLHLVGYDHEEDDEYLEMVEREEAILKDLEL